MYQHNLQASFIVSERCPDQICWGALDIGGKGYDDAGQTAYLDSTLRWGLDWLINAHPNPDTLYVQVGNGMFIFTRLLSIDVWTQSEPRIHTGEVTRTYLIHDWLMLSQARNLGRTSQPQQPQPSHLALCSIPIVHSLSLHHLQRLPGLETPPTPRPFLPTRDSSLISLSTPLVVNNFIRVPLRPWQMHTHPDPWGMISYSQHSSSPTQITQLYSSLRRRSGGTNISLPRPET